MDLILLPDVLSVCRLGPDGPPPAWAAQSPWVSITRTAEELSIVCAESAVPDEVQCVRGWRCLRVAGKLDFALVGVLASLVAPLAEAGISVFVISTYDTDYLMVRGPDLGGALGVLADRGHAVRR
jgi:hypothetical protein